MSIASYLKRTTFWEKVNKTIQVIGTFTQLTLIFGDAQHIYNLVVAAAQLLGLLLPVWFDDKDHDGLVDIFQEETTTTITVKGTGPTEVEVTKEPTNE